MGKTTRSEAQMTTIQEGVGDVVRDLQSAIAAEGLAGYQYRLFGNVVKGDMSRELREMFHEMAEGEHKHMHAFMDRVTELGATPLASPSEWESHSYADPGELPEDAGDDRAFLEEALRIENDAVRFYSDLAKKTRESDPVTWRLAVKTLAHEVKDRVEIERLLGGRK